MHITILLALSILPGEAKLTACALSHQGWTSSYVCAYGYVLRSQLTEAVEKHYFESWVIFEGFWTQNNGPNSTN